MQLPKTTLICAIAATLGLAQAQQQYLLDDGTAEGALGFSYAQDYCWMQWFQALPGGDTIQSVQVAFPPSTPVGTPVHLCVWDDPNDDGDPSDLVLVSTRATTVSAHGVNQFSSYALLSPAPVQGLFFVGAYLTEDGSMGPAQLDYSVNPHAAFFTFSPPATMDPQNFTFPLTHIEVLGAGIHGAYLLRAEGSGTVPHNYCVSKVSSLGCVPTIGSFGLPSATSGSGHFVIASSIPAGQFGFLIYSTTGPDSAPFHGGALCIAQPLHRTVVQQSGGSIGPPSCTGVYSFDFNAWAASGVDPQLTAGATVWAQYIFRDQGYLAPDNYGLTDGLVFTLAP